MEFQWRLNWWYRPTQLDGFESSVTDYYECFCDWKASMKLNSCPAVEADYVHAFIQNLRSDIQSRLPKYVFSMRLNCAFLAAKLEESTIRIEESLKKIGAHKPFDEMPGQVSAVCQDSTDEVVKISCLQIISSDSCTIGLANNPLDDVVIENEESSGLQDDVLLKLESETSINDEFSAQMDAEKETPKVFEEMPDQFSVKLLEEIDGDKCSIPLIDCVPRVFDPGTSIGLCIHYKLFQPSIISITGSKSIYGQCHTFASFLGQCKSVISFTSTDMVFIFDPGGCGEPSGFWNKRVVGMLCCHLVECLVKCMCSHIISLDDEKKRADMGNEEFGKMFGMISGVVGSAWLGNSYDAINKRSNAFEFRADRKHRDQFSTNQGATLTRKKMLEFAMYWHDNLWDWVVEESMLVFDPGGSWYLMRRYKQKISGILIMVKRKIEVERCDLEMLASQSNFGSTFYPLVHGLCTWILFLDLLRYTTHEADHFGAVDFPDFSTQARETIIGQSMLLSNNYGTECAIYTFIIVVEHFVWDPGRTLVLIPFIVYIIEDNDVLRGMEKILYW